MHAISVVNNDVIDLLSCLNIFISHNIIQHNIPFITI